MGKDWSKIWQFENNFIRNEILFHKNEYIWQEKKHATLKKKLYRYPVSINFCILCVVLFHFIVVIVYLFVSHIDLFCK